jgi:hypothetical protein
MMENESTWPSLCEYLDRRHMHCGKTVTRSECHGSDALKSHNRCHWNLEPEHACIKVETRPGKFEPWP